MFPIGRDLLGFLFFCRKFTISTAPASAPTRHCLKIGFHWSCSHCLTWLSLLRQPYFPFLRSLCTHISALKHAAAKAGS